MEIKNERDKRIRSALIRHQAFVRSQNFEPVMTVLVGSQNYGLDLEDSDYDTYTFILPSVTEVATLAEPVSTKFHDELGDINIKDIRIALNRLRKTSPNSVEWFASKYHIIDSKYQPVLEGRITPGMLRCDTKNMLHAIVGLTKQIKTRNMTDGKRLSHMLRLHSMASKYFVETPDLHDILMPYDYDRNLGLKAKRDPDNPEWARLLVQYERDIQDYIQQSDEDAFKGQEAAANQKVVTLQEDLMLYLFDSRSYHPDKK